MELFAEKREIKGTKVKTLRNKGVLPAVLYSTNSSKGQKEVVNLSLNLADFKKVFKEAGTSALVNLHINSGDAVNVLIHEVQTHPLDLAPLHVGFYEVNMKENIDTEVPISVINEDTNEAVKNGEGIIITVLSTINARSLPINIPPEFEVDAANLKEVGDVITVADLKYDKSKVEILNEPDEVILKLDFAQQLEVEEEITSVADVEVIKEKDEKEEGTEDESSSDAKEDKKE